MQLLHYRLFFGCLLSVWDVGSDIAVVVSWLAGIGGAPHYWWGSILFLIIIVPTMLNTWVFCQDRHKSVPAWLAVFSMIGLAPISFALGVGFNDDKKAKTDNKENYERVKLMEILFEAAPSGILQMYVLFHSSHPSYTGNDNAPSPDMLLWFSVVASGITIYCGPLLQELSWERFGIGTQAFLTFVSHSMALLVIPVIFENHIIGMALFVCVVFTFEAFLCLSKVDKLLADAWNTLYFILSCASLIVTNSSAFIIYDFPDDEYRFDCELAVRFFGDIAILSVVVALSNEDVRPWPITGLVCAILTVVTRVLGIKLDSDHSL